MSYRPRILVLPVSALIITALCWWRIAHPPGQSQPESTLQNLHPAPSFQLYDQNSEVVRLDAFLHRHVIVLAFYDGQKGPDADPLLMKLADFYPALRQEGIIVLGISTALPQENRNKGRRNIPFPLLSDVAATDERSVHRVWGRIIPPPTLDKPAGTRPAVFVIDRSGMVPWDKDHPRPETSPDQLIAKLLG